MKGSEIIFTGFILIFIGFFLIFAGFLKQITEAKAGTAGKTGEKEARTEVRGGGIIMIGPFPIIFGTDKQSIFLLFILAVLLMLISWLFIKSIRM